MINNKRPEIIIVTSGTIDNKILDNILAGIEEQSVLYRVEFENKVNNIIRSAYDAAKQSLLGVGIVLDGNEAVLHVSKLEVDRPLFYNKNIDVSYARALGANAARYVKSIPFIL